MRIVPPSNPSDVSLIIELDASDSLRVSQLGPGLKTWLAFTPDDGLLEELGTACQRMKARRANGKAAMRAAEPYLAHRNGIG